MGQDLDLKFKETFEKISTLNTNITPDIKLRLYAYYKQATHGNNFTIDSSLNIKNAFKFNAWAQVSSLTKDQAKEEYISLANTIINQ